MSRRPLIAILLALVIAGLLLALVGRRADDPAPLPPAATATAGERTRPTLVGREPDRASAPAAPGAAPTEASPARGLRRITAARHAELSAQLAAAQARRAAAPPAAPRKKLTVETIPDPVKQALQASLDVLGECYGDVRGFPVVVMTLVGDPAIGTIASPKAMTDEHGAPPPPAIEACLRETFHTLELPPLDEGDQVDIQFTFAIGQVPVEE